MRCDRRRFLTRIGLVLLCMFPLIVNAGQTQPQSAPASSIALSKDGSPLSLDDFKYSSRLNRLVVPAAQTGMLFFIDPVSNKSTTLEGFGTTPAPGGGRGAGITSVDESKTGLLVTDRSSLKLQLVDPKTMKVTSSAQLSAGPDYVRYVAPTNEIWVTEPHAEQLEIFSFPASPEAPPVRNTTIGIKGGPEALVIDAARGLAYTNIDGGQTVVIDLKSRKILHTWPNGCEGAEGLAMHDSGKFLFVACGEGKVVSLNLNEDGKVISTVASGAGIDIIDYNAKLKHVYAPGAKSATMGILAVSPEGSLSLVRTVNTVEGGHCVASTPNGAVYVCDPHHGGLIVIKDTF